MMPDCAIQELPKRERFYVKLRAIIQWLRGCAFDGPRALIVFLKLARTRCAASAKYYSDGRNLRGSWDLPIARLRWFVMSVSLRFFANLFQH